jgi:hypothetical protein
VHACCSEPRVFSDCCMCVLLITGVLYSVSLEWCDGWCSARAKHALCVCCTRHASVAAAECRFPLHTNVTHKKNHIVSHELSAVTTSLLSNDARDSDCPGLRCANAAFSGPVEMRMHMKRTIQHSSSRAWYRLVGPRAWTSRSTVRLRVGIPHRIPVRQMRQ